MIYIIIKFIDLSSIMFNNYLVISMSVCNSLQCDNKDTDYFFTSLLFFSYFNNSDFNINITSYFSNIESDEYDDNDDITIPFPKNSKIDNNIFGYQILEKIKIISIPNEINLYLINGNYEKTEIKVGDEINPNNINITISPKNDIIKNNSIYFIEYQYLYTDPDYDTFNNYPDTIISYPEDSSIDDQREEFNKDIKIHFSNTLKIEFKLCNENCKTCKIIGKSDILTRCEECFENRKYFFDEETNSKTCFPECKKELPITIFGKSLICNDTPDIFDSKDNILENLRNELNNGYIDILIDNIILKKNKNIIYRDNNIIYELTSTDVKNNDNNISSINLGNCENKLKINNSINISEPLLILKVDIYELGILIPTIEYEIYNIKTKQKLNLSICENDKVDIFIPVKIDENKLYKYNISDDYYNDICYISDGKIDIILSDKKKEFYKNNMSVCEKDCTFKDYNYDTKKVSCECFIKIKFPLISEIEVNKNKFIDDISNISNIINLDIIKCYKTVFTKEGLIYNIGNYILISIIILNIIILISFNINGFKKIKNQIEYITKNKINEKNENKWLKDEPPKKRKRESNINTLVNMNRFEAMNDNSDFKFKKNVKFNNNKSIELSTINNIDNNNLIKYTDNELNGLSYQEALIIDKRTYINYYFSLLKTKHIILFTFFNNDDYNSKLIKIYLFLFTFALFLIINALFFNDSTMHKIYELNGNYSFINQLPIIFYSSIISTIIKTIIKYLSLSENDILQLKSEINDIIKKSEKILKCLKIKFTLFFILTFILLILFWYYLSYFCAIYRNTQIHLIKDTLISYALSLLYPLVIYLFPGIFRIPSLRAKNKDKAYMYILSKFMQLI